MTVSDQAIIDSCHATLRNVAIDPLLSVYNTSLSADQCRFSGTKSASGIGINGSNSNSIEITNSVISQVILAETGSNIVSFTYDTIYGRLGVEADSVVPSGVTFDDSIIAGSASVHPDSARCSTCSFTHNVIFPQSTGIANNIEMDPKLVDPANGDLHLGSGSPAIDASDNQADNHDYDGTARPQGPSNDIGAFEFKP